MRNIFLTLILSFGFQVHAKWNLNDVSFLLPLPEKIDEDFLLRRNDVGGKGEILPKLWVDQLPPLEMTSGRNEMDEALRVISVRIDPCFFQISPERCEKQIRFVWQPVLPGPRQSVITEDAALHSFYTLNDSEFADLLKDLKEWKKKFNPEDLPSPLQVSSFLKNSRANHEALSTLQSVFLKYIGKGNLTKLTAMGLRGGGDMWVFFQFDIVDGKPVAQPIARLGNKLAQAFVNQVSPATSFGRVQVAPEPESEDFFRTLVTSSGTLNESHDPLIQKEMEILYRIENPKNFHANNMDCVSCHVAQPAKQWAFRARPYLNLQTAWVSSVYQNSRHNLENTTPGLWSTHMLRGFGYFGSQPAISQRVINESAEVADQLEQMAP